LLTHSAKDAWHRGSYKTSANSVAAFDEAGRQVAVVFETATPFDTPRLMAELVEWHDRAGQSGRLHPLLAVGIFIVGFLAIHPFQDGNGRLSRILTTLALLRAGYVYVPYVSLESIVEKSKEEYYLALRRTQATMRSDAPDWQPWIAYFLRALREQTRRLAGKMEREKLLLSALPELALRVLDMARAHGRVTIGDAVAITGANRNTLKEHFRTLVKRGFLEMHGKGRGAWYGLR